MTTINKTEVRINKLRKSLENFYKEPLSVHVVCRMTTECTGGETQIWVFNRESDITVYVTNQPNLSTAIDALWKQIERNAKQ